jgi:hypothetical protein
MRTLSSRLLAATLLAPSVAAAPDMPIHRESSSTVVLRFDAAGVRTVDLRTITGSIRLTTDNRDDVRVTLMRRTDAEREDDLPMADRDVRLETSTRGATVSVIGIRSAATRRRGVVILGGIGPGTTSASI